VWNGEAQEAGGFDMSIIVLARRAVFPFLILFFLAPTIAGAAWTEAGSTILTLEEAMASLDSAGGGAVRSALPGDTPILMPGDASDLKSLKVALLLSGLSLRPGGEIIQPKGLDERSRAERRRLPHFAATPRGGNTIDQGGLVLFGTLHEPPFAVEVVGTEILINGVAVYPSPGPAATPPAPSAEQRSFHEKLETAGAAFAAAAGGNDAQKIREELAATMLDLDGIENAEWTSDQDLQLTHSDGSIEVIAFDHEAREADPDPAASQDEALRSLAEGLRRVLRDNYTVMAGASYLLTVTNSNADAFFQRIREIEDSSDSEALKLARLQAWTGQRNAAADLLFNR